MEPDMVLRILDEEDVHENSEPRWVVHNFVKNPMTLGRGKDCDVRYIQCLNFHPNN